MLGLYQRILCVRDKLLGPDSLMTITIADEIAQVSQFQESHKKALEWYERALAGYKKLHAAGRLMVINTVFNMARIFHKLGRYDKALDCYERAVAGYRKLLDPDHDLALLTLNQMAALHYEQKDYSNSLGLALKNYWPASRSHLARIINLPLILSTTSDKFCTIKVTMTKPWKVMSEP